ncbi:hypothetical protein M758_3G009500 [Ceratodon purpureus]|nr:hypothetical protein M758_3G009500 [Ceratodon purpureus]
MMDEQRRRGFGPGWGSRGASICSFSGVFLCSCQLQFGFVLPKVQSGAGNRSLSSLLSRAPCAAWLVSVASDVCWWMVVLIVGFRFRLRADCISRFVDWSMSCTVWMACWCSVSG